MQNTITKTVKKEIENERDLTIILKTLADSEEDIGKLYQKISDHMMHLSRYYKELAGEIEKIADEEYDHRDLLLKDREYLTKKQ